MLDRVPVSCRFMAINFPFNERIWDVVFSGDSGFSFSSFSTSLSRSSSQLLNTSAVFLIIPEMIEPYWDRIAALNNLGVSPALISTGRSQSQHFLFLLSRTR